MRYINELREGENVVGHYLCKSKQTLKSRAGKSYYSLKLQDKTGLLDGKVWDLNNEIKSFEESITIADGQTAYCIDINTDFKSGYKNRINAEDRMSDEQITDVALSLEYVKEYAKKHTSLSNTQVYLLEQCVV